MKALVQGNELRCLNSYKSKIMINLNLSLTKDIVPFDVSTDMQTKLQKVEYNVKDMKQGIRELTEE